MRDGPGGWRTFAGPSLLLWHGGGAPSPGRLDATPSGIRRRRSTARGLCPRDGVTPWCGVAPEGRESLAPQLLGPLPPDHGKDLMGGIDGDV
ncbi:MAG TPA: hypothetical protein PK393_10250 [Synergistaceae bacterium]|nr:hypothetical protein [Synergistaceae bacterium]HQK25889.1 hypothetical protein [Synergistaceae bacterium]